MDISLLSYNQSAYQYKVAVVIVCKPSGKLAIWTNYEIPHYVEIDMVL